MQKRRAIITSLQQHDETNTNRNKLEEQDLMFIELGQYNKKWGDKLKTNAIINIAMVGRLNKSYKELSLNGSTTIRNATILNSKTLGENHHQRNNKIGGGWLIHQE
jgi:hypothetical protein